MWEVLFLWQGAKCRVWVELLWAQGPGTLLAQPPCKGINYVDLGEKHICSKVMQRQRSANDNKTICLNQLCSEIERDWGGGKVHVRKDQWVSMENT
jgi:hypothetical protein